MSHNVAGLVAQALHGATIESDEEAAALGAVVHVLADDYRAMTDDALSPELRQLLRLVWIAGRVWGRLQASERLTTL